MGSKSFEALRELISKASQDELLKVRTSRMVKTYQFRPINAQPFQLKIVRGSLSVEEGEAQDPVATIIATDEDLASVIYGVADATQLFFMGRIKVYGSLYDAQELGTLLRDASRTR
jgi:putative sterol carrier protein